MKTITIDSKKIASLILENSDHYGNHNAAISVDVTDGELDLDFHKSACGDWVQLIHFGNLDSEITGVELDSAWTDTDIEYLAEVVREWLSNLDEHRAVTDYNDLSDEPVDFRII